MFVHVVGTKVNHSDLSGLHAGDPVLLVPQPENRWDSNAVLVLRADADPDAVRKALRSPLRDFKKRVLRRGVPGMLGYLAATVAGSGLGEEIREGKWQATIASAPWGVRLELTPRDPEGHHEADSHHRS